MQLPPQRRHPNERSKRTLLRGPALRYNRGMNAICLVVDRLHAGYVGAYGNAWVETPALDRLASQATVFDQALIDSPRLESLCRSYWQGWHALCPREPPEARPSLAALLREAGVTTALLTDEPRVARHPLAVDFDDLIEIDPPWQPRSAVDIEQTLFARFFVHVLDWLESAPAPFMLWGHLGGLGTTWDAPLKFRQAYCEEGDPPPPLSADVPDQFLPAGHDPDDLLGIVQSYAGQVTLLDTCLDALLEFLDGTPAGRETLVVVTSARGFPLGEHRRVGPCDEALFGELVHVPWMMRMPSASPLPLGEGSGVRAAAGWPDANPSLPKSVETISAAGARCQALVEPADLWATLLDFWQIAPPQSPTARSLLPLVRQQAAAPRDRLCIRSGIERAIRTPAWYLRLGAEPELFVKPDDRWEVNNVANRCAEVVECLQDALTQYELSLPSGRIADLPPLSDVLLRGLE